MSIGREFYMQTTIYIPNAFRLPSCGVRHQPYV